MPIQTALGAGRQGVFTVTEALASGWTPSSLRTAVRRDHLVRLQRGVYCPPYVDAPHPREIERIWALRAAVATSLTLAGATVSHVSALTAAGIPTWRPTDHGCVTVARRLPGSRHAVHLHRARLPTNQLRADGFACTTVTRAIIDTAREHGRMDAIVAGDAALRAGLTSTDELTAVAAECARWPGVRRAREVIGQLSPLAESPLESISRVHLRAALLPDPELQVALHDRFGTFLGRADFYWDEFGVVGEADGHSKYDALDVLVAEKKRQERLEAAGLVVVRWDASDLRVDGLLRRRILQAFAAGVGRSRPNRMWTARPTRPPLLAETSRLVASSGSRVTIA